MIELTIKISEKRDESGRMGLHVEADGHGRGVAPEFKCPHPDACTGRERELARMILDAADTLTMFMTGKTAPGPDDKRTIFERATPWPPTSGGGE